MASEEELKRKYDMLTDTWKLYRKFADVKEDDEYWKQLVDESCQITRKYGECRFIINLVSAVMNELERICKEMKASAGTQLL